MKLPKLKIVISMLLSALIVWFILSMCYFLITGEVLQMAISGSILMFITFTYLFNVMIDDIKKR